MGEMGPTGSKGEMGSTGSQGLMGPTGYCFTQKIHFNSLQMSSHDQTNDLGTRIGGMKEYSPTSLPTFYPMLCDYPSTSNKNTEKLFIFTLPLDYNGTTLKVLFNVILQVKPAYGGNLRVKFQVSLFTKDSIDINIGSWNQYISPLSVDTAVGDNIPIVGYGVANVVNVAVRQIVTLNLPAAQPGYFAYLSFIRILPTVGVEAGHDTDNYHIGLGGGIIELA